jgi:hypothetical protein
MKNFCLSCLRLRREGEQTRTEETQITFSQQNVDHLIKLLTKSYLLFEKSLNKIINKKLFVI